MEEAGSGHEDSSHNILTLDALQVLSRSQVTLGCQCPCGYGRYVKSLHTYIQGKLCTIPPCTVLGNLLCLQVMWPRVPPR
jgi:hypothetical protein